MSHNKKETNFEKFINGDFGLAVTYWVFLFGVNTVFKVLFTILNQSGEKFSIIFLIIIWFVYEPLALIATARATKKYQGKNVWKFLANIAVILAWIGYIFSILIAIDTILSLTNEPDNSYSSKEISNYAIEKKDLPIAKKNSAINAYDLMLIDAVENNDTQKALEAIKNGANVNLDAKNFENIGTLLMVATLKDNKKIVQALINHKANVLYKNSRGNSFLHVACQNDILPIALKTEAKRYINDPVDMTIFKAYPITIALFNKQYNNVKLLLKNKALLPKSEEKKVFEYLQKKHLQDLLNEFRRYGYFKSNINKKITLNPIIPQKRINSLFLDRSIKDVVEYKNNLFITYEKGENTYLYQYKLSDIWELKKSFLIQDYVCTKPIVNDNSLALYCRGKKNLYLLDLKNFSSKNLHLNKYITDLVWDKDKLICANSGFKIVWRDKNLNVVDKIDYDFSLAPLYIRENVKKSDFNLANVQLRKNGDKILAFSHYLTMLIDIKSKKILQTKTNLIPMEMYKKEYNYLKDWDEFFKTKQKWANWTIFATPDDVWLERVGKNYYINILSLRKLIIWQWPQKRNKNIAIINYDLNHSKTIDIKSGKYLPRKYAGSLNYNGKRVAIFYTSKGFELINYAKDLKDIKMLSYAPKPNLNIKSFFYNEIMDEIHLFMVSFNSDVDEFFISTKNGKFHFDFEPSINLPKNYLNGLVLDKNYSYRLRRNYHIEKWQGKKEIKETLTLVKHPWGMVKCDEDIAIYGTGKWCGLNILDKNLTNIACKYKKGTVKAISCFENKKILSLPEKIVLYNSWKQNPKVLANLPKLLDEVFALGFVKGIPFYAGRKDNILALHILDKEEKILKLDFFPMKALVKNSYIALVDNNTLIVQYNEKLKKITKIKGVGLDWWKDSFIYSKDGAIYKYNLLTKNSKKIIDFDIRKYQGMVEDVFIKDDTLIYVMSDMYAVLVNLESKKVIIEQFFNDEI